MTETGTTYEPISISPASDGWRATYIYEPRDRFDQQCTVEPLIAWAVYQVTREQDHGRAIHGVVFDDYGNYPHCPEETGNFWRYLRPGESEPEPADIEAEQRARWPNSPSW